MLMMSMYDTKTRQLFEEFLTEVLVSNGVGEIPDYDLEANDRTHSMDEKRLSITVGVDRIALKRPSQAGCMHYHRILYLPVDRLLDSDVKRYVVRDTLTELLHQLYQVNAGSERLIAFKKQVIDGVVEKDQHACDSENIKRTIIAMLHTANDLGGSLEVIVDSIGEVVLNTHHESGNAPAHSDLQVTYKFI